MLRSSITTGAMAAALAVAAMSSAQAIPIIAEFNFVPFGTLTANTGDVTTATTITPGAPDNVTSILANNIGLVTGQTITLTSPTPVTLASTFTKSFTTTLNGQNLSFVENLTVTGVTIGPDSRGITASGTITQTVGTGFDPTPVFYSAAYTQNAGPGSQINASFNDSTVAIPGPIVGAGLPGLIVACGGLLALARRRRQKTA